MSLSAYLLVLSLSVNATPVPVIQSQQPVRTIVEPTPIYSYQHGVKQERAPLFPRLQGIFSKESKNPPCVGCGTIYPTAPQTISHPVTVAPVAQPQPQAQPVEVKAAPEATPRNLPRIGAAPDYSWITGELFKIHAGGQEHWVVRYAPPDQDDKYGGSVVLAAAASLKNFREGDLICVHGEILESSPTNKYVRGALYRASSIDMVERIDTQTNPKPKY